MWVLAPWSIRGIDDIMSDKLPHSAPPREELSGGVPGAGTVAGSNVTQPGPGQPDLVRGVAGSNVSSPDAQVVIRAGEGANGNVSFAEAQMLAAGNIGGVEGRSVSPGSNITPSTHNNLDPLLQQDVNPRQQ